MINIAVLGYGTVGSGVVEVINTNHEALTNGQVRRSISNMFWILRDFREIR